MEVMKITVTSFKTSRASKHCCTQCPHPATGHLQPTPPPETPGHSRASLGQSLVGPLLLSPGSWCAQDFVCALQESVSPVLCKFWLLYGEVHGDPPEVCCTQSPCPCSSPLLTHTSPGDTQTQFCLSLYGIFGSWCTQGLFEPSEHLWWCGLSRGTTARSVSLSWGAREVGSPPTQKRYPTSRGKGEAPERWWEG